jgi:hypothetical protein
MRSIGMRVDPGVAEAVSLQTMIYFGATGGSLALAVSLLYARYVRKDAQAIRSGGGFTLFAIALLLFALGAAAAGLASARAG